MLFDNARLEPGESVLVHAGGSGIGTAAILMAKAIGCTVYTTVGDDEKGADRLHCGDRGRAEQREEQDFQARRVEADRAGVTLVEEGHHQVLPFRQQHDQ